MGVGSSGGLWCVAPDPAPCNGVCGTGKQATGGWSPALFPAAQSGAAAPMALHAQQLACNIATPSPAPTFNCRPTRAGTGASSVSQCGNAVYYLDSSGHWVQLTGLPGIKASARCIWCNSIQQGAAAQGSIGAALRQLGCQRACPMILKQLCCEYTSSCSCAMDASVSNTFSFDCHDLQVIPGPTNETACETWLGGLGSSAAGCTTWRILMLRSCCHVQLWLPSSCSAHCEQWSCFTHSPCLPFPCALQMSSTPAMKVGGSAPGGTALSIVRIAIIR